MSPFIEIEGRNLSVADRRIRKQRQLTTGELTYVGYLSVLILSDDELLVQRNGLSSSIRLGIFDPNKGFVRDEDNVFKDREMMVTKVVKRSIYVEGTNKMIE